MWKSAGRIFPAAARAFRCSRDHLQPSPSHDNSTAPEALRPLFEIPSRRQFVQFRRIPPGAHNDPPAAILETAANTDQA